MSRPAILIVSGGAETTSLAILEWALGRGDTPWVFALDRRSLLEPYVRADRFAVAPGDDRRRVIDALRAFAAEARSASGAGPLVAFPSEDDGFGLLVELQREDDSLLRVSRCRALASGGLDKTELFELLAARGAGPWLPDFAVIRSQDDVAPAVARLGPDAVFKPPHKPWARGLAGGSKVFDARALGTRNARAELDADLARGRPWIAQRRLRPLDGGERSAIVVRGENCFRYAEVLERAKYPAEGGTACWVETQPGSTRLLQATRAVLEAVDAVGVVELSYLADDDGRPRLLELNARPWLQIELLQRAGFDVLGEALGVLAGERPPSGTPDLAQASWISCERFVAKCLRGDGAPRSVLLRQLVRTVRDGAVVATWSSRLRGVRSRWFARLVGKALRLS